MVPRMNTKLNDKPSVRNLRLKNRVYVVITKSLISGIILNSETCFFKKNRSLFLFLRPEEEAILFKEQSKALFYTQGKDETLDELQSSREGLSTAEA